MKSTMFGGPSGGSNNYTSLNCGQAGHLLHQILMGNTQDLEDTVTYEITQISSYMKPCSCTGDLNENEHILHK